jgi:hypothetical protein
MPKARPNKSAFIRNLPGDMPAVEVVAKAKAADMKISPAFVYAIRSKLRKKSPAKSAKRGRKPASGKPTASEFVRTQPATMKAGDVVSAGAAKGLKFSTNLVYAVRSAGGGKRGPRASKGSKTASVSLSGGTEATFRRLSLDLGIGRARLLLDELEKKLKELIG